LLCPFFSLLFSGLFTIGGAKKNIAYRKRLIDSTLRKALSKTYLCCNSLYYECNRMDIFGFRDRDHYCFGF
jgi:hypothetical protein